MELLKTKGQDLFTLQLDRGGLELDITRLKQELSETDLYKEIQVKEQQLEEMKQREQEIKDSILEGMLISDTKTLEVNNQRYTVKQNPPALKIVDESKIPEKYKEEKTEIVINKAELKKDLKEGYPIEGAELTKGYSLQITVK